MTGVLTLILMFAATGDTTANTAWRGDSLFYAMRYAEAISAYDSLLSIRRNDPDLLWRLARAYVCYGESFEDHQRKELCLKADTLARQCISVNESIGEGHTWLAGALGYIALDEGMQRQAELSREILVEANRALELNPRDDAALSIKGSLYRALGKVDWIRRRMASLLLGGLPDGGFEEGEAALLQAIAIAPNVMRHHYELAVLYYDWERWEDARNEFQKAAALPIHVAIDVPRRLKALEFLKILASR